MDAKADRMEVVTRWALIALGVVVLLRLKFVLFAAALPILAYWHYSGEKTEDAQEEAPLEEKEASEVGSDEDLPPFKGKEESDIYGDEFWSEKKTKSQRDELNTFSWDAGRDELDDLLADDLGSSFPKADLHKDEDDLGLGGPRHDFGLGDLGGGLDADFRFGGDDFDHRRDRDEGKGKGKGKSKDKSKEPREADPKQVFVANIGDAQEDELRAFFEQAGDVDRLKVLKNPDGTTKGIGFVTFRTEEQAQKALSFHNRPFEGGNIVVRLAHAGNKKGDKGDKGEGKGGRFEERDDRFEERRRPERPEKGKSKGRGKGSKGTADVDEALEEVISGHDGPLRMADFDFAARRFLGELRSRDRADGGARFSEAMDMVLKYTSTKDRSSVRKWTAYVFTLLQKFDPALSEEIRERDQERRSKGIGRARMSRQTSDDD